MGSSRKLRLPGRVAKLGRQLEIYLSFTDEEAENRVHRINEALRAIMHITRTHSIIGLRRKLDDHVSQSRTHLGLSFLQPCTYPPMIDDPPGSCQHTAKPTALKTV